MRETRVNRWIVAAGLAAVTMLVACSTDNGKTALRGDAGVAVAGGSQLTGAGATFPNPIYSKWFADYAAKTGVEINYQSIGSGGGIRQLSEETVDFGASDAPMTDAELANAKGGPILQFPTVLGAVVVTYNLPSVPKPLRLTSAVLSDIFAGRVTKWNVPAITSLNPGVSLPALDILVVHRTDGSGTTFIFTSYLAATSPAWKAGPGAGKEVSWPTGLGGKGNEGVAGQVKQTPGSIGYIELAYAKQNNLPYAAIQNATGAFVQPTTASITAAAAAIADTLSTASDYRLSLVNGGSTEAYPISSMTWLLVYKNQPNATKGKQLTDFLRWSYETGYQAAASLDYAPLPEKLRQRLLDRISTINVGGA